MSGDERDNTSSADDDFTPAPTALRLGAAAKPPLLDITQDRGESFRISKGCWNAFVLSGLDQHPTATKHAALITCLTYEVVCNLALPGHKKDDVYAIIEPLERRTQESINTIIERRNFNNRT